MEKLYLFFLCFIVLTQAQYLTEDCDCATGYHVEPDTNSCVKSPVSGESGFVENCQTYFKKKNPESNLFELKCQECISSTHIGSPSNENIESCIPHNIQNCLRAEHVTEVMANLQFECIECNDNLVANTCASLPVPEDANYVANCAKYLQDIYNNSVECVECTADGQYINSGNKQCEAVSSAMDGCKKYLNSETECIQCNPGKVLQKNPTSPHGSACVNEPSDMTGCTSFSTTDGSTFQCHECSGNYSLKSDNSGCEAITISAVDNCIAYDSPTSCGQCDPNMYRASATQCSTCPKKCTKSVTAKECIAIFDSDCTVADVDTSLFTEMQLETSKICVKNECIDKSIQLQQIVSIPAQGDFINLDLIPLLNYDEMCFQTIAQIYGLAGKTESTDELVSVNLYDCTPPCSVRIKYQFRNTNFSIFSQTGSYTYSANQLGGITFIQGFTLQGENSSSKSYPRPAVSLTELQISSATYTISDRLQLDFTTPFTPADVSMGDDVYYKVTPKVPGEAINTSNLKVSLTAKEDPSVKLELSQTSYSFNTQGSNEYEKLTLSGEMIGEYHISVQDK